MALYAFDGTWNSATLYDDVEQEDETNVPKFCEAYRDETWYVAGPGTRFGKVGRVLGGTTGMGARSRVREAYDQLCKNFERGDTMIDIVGFSRGAALALDFANKVEDDGVRRAGSKEVLVERPEIRFLGLWDVVGSFGIPISGSIIPFQEINFGHKLDLPDNVQYCFHAMAIDERRQTFRVTRILNGYEVWFRGVHSDVGGGNGNVALSYIALRWMLRKARAAGLPIDEAALASRDGQIDSQADVRPSVDMIPNEYRGFLTGDRFHYSLIERADHNNPQADAVRESEEDELTALAVTDLPVRRATPAPTTR
jgi:uncharacterized protein (DUF2235 family)